MMASVRKKLVNQDLRTALVIDLPVVERSKNLYTKRPYSARVWERNSGGGGCFCTWHGQIRSGFIIYLSCFCWLQHALKIVLHYWAYFLYIHFIPGFLVCSWTNVSMKGGPRLTEEVGTLKGSSGKWCSDSSWSNLLRTVQGLSTASSLPWKMSFFLPEAATAF